MWSKIIKNGYISKNVNRQISYFYNFTFQKITVTLLANQTNVIFNGK